MFFLSSHILLVSFKGPLSTFATVMLYKNVVVIYHAMEASGIINNTYLPHYRQVSNIRRTLVGNKIVDNSDVVGASPVGAAPTTSSLSI